MDHQICLVPDQNPNIRKIKKKKKKKQRDYASIVTNNNYKKKLTAKVDQEVRIPEELK
jgi:hypothetical protein